SIDSAGLRVCNMLIISSLRRYHNIRLLMYTFTPTSLTASNRSQLARPICVTALRYTLRYTAALPLLRYTADIVRTDDFDYRLPQHQIAQRPLAQRDASRLLLLHRTTCTLEDSNFSQLPDLLRTDDLLVFNNARVIPA